MKLLKGWRSRDPGRRALIFSLASGAETGRMSGSWRKANGSYWRRLTAEERV
jgi:hypothetical protein